MCPNKPEGVRGENRNVMLAKMCAQTSQKICEVGKDVCPKKSEDM